MKVGELRKLLDKYDDETFVCITINGAKSYYHVDKVEETTLGKPIPILVADEAPDFADIEGFADACWDEHYKSLSELEKQAIREFSDIARESERESRNT